MFYSKFLNVELEKNVYFSGCVEDGNENENVPFSLALDILRYFIWQCKLNKQKPVFSLLSEEVTNMINQIRKSDIGISDLYHNCSFFKHGEDEGERGDGRDGRG